MSRLMQVLLRRPDAPVFDREGHGHTYLCTAAATCNHVLIRIRLEAQRANGTLVEALERTGRTGRGNLGPSWTMS